MARYQVWNRTDSIITPSGEVFTPEQWIAKHPIAGIEAIKTVISGDVINGAILYEFTGFVKRMEQMGCDFSACTTDEEYLSAIEAFEDARNAAAANEVTAEERIASALEYQNLMAE